MSHTKLPRLSDDPSAAALLDPAEHVRMMANDEVTAGVDDPMRQSNVFWRWTLNEFVSPMQRHDYHIVLLTRGLHISNDARLVTLCVRRPLREVLPRPKRVTKESDSESVFDDRRRNARAMTIVETAWLNTAAAQQVHRLCERFRSMLHRVIGGDIHHLETRIDKASQVGSVSAHLHGVVVTRAKTAFRDRAFEIAKAQIRPL